LRPTAYLGLVFLSDEDDCSAALNDGMFGDQDSLKWRISQPALRHARTQVQWPESDRYASWLSDDGRIQRAPLRPARRKNGFSCPNVHRPWLTETRTDTSVPTDCSPLKNIKHLAEELKALKYDPDNQIVVAGIFGWPLSDADMATATYTIGPVPNPNPADTAHPTVFDLWPVCYDPNYKPASSTEFAPSAAGRGATPGLRLSAFVDEFGKNGLKASICQSDFSATMSQIGTTLAQQLSNRCLPSSYAQYKTCAAHCLVPDSAGGYTRQADVVPSCDASPSVPGCYTLVADGSPCAPGEFLVQVDSSSAMPRGTVLEFSCQ
jgi:hypothetical protein